MPKDPNITKQEWVPEDPDELFKKTIAQLIKDMPDGVAAQVYNRVDKNGNMYMFIHGRAVGAKLLQRMAQREGIIQGPVKATVTKRTKA